MSHSLFNKPGVISGGWKSHHGPMNIVDFSQILEVVDTYAAYACITVCTSNGKWGTITHLDTTDVSRIHEFVNALDALFISNKNSTKVILSGGSSLKDSKHLVATLKDTLKSFGYSIIGHYLDLKTKNPAPKIATLTKDKVMIKEFMAEENKDKITEIDFKDGSKNSYYVERKMPKKDRNTTSRRLL